MSYFVQFCCVFSLYIALACGNFINFEEGLEYNFHFSSNLTTEDHEGTSSLTLFDADLKLQKTSENKFHGQFYNGGDKLKEIFSIVMDGQKLNSVEGLMDFTVKELTETYVFLKPLILDYTGISKNLIDPKHFRNETRLLFFVLSGFCGSNIRNIEDLQKSTIKHCRYALEIVNVWEEDKLAFVNGQSESIFFDQNTKISDGLTTKITLKIKTSKGFLTNYIEQRYTLLDMKKIENEFHLDGNIKQLTLPFE